MDCRVVSETRQVKAVTMTLYTARKLENGSFTVVGANPCVPRPL